MPTASSPRTVSPPESTAEAIIIVKASPQLGNRHGETVCTAGIARDGAWVRLYPIAFRTLKETQQFSRWDTVRYQWHRPKDDPRVESRRVEHHTLAVSGEIRPQDRFGLVSPMIKDSLVRERAEGRSLAFIRPSIRKFLIEKKPEAELKAETERYALHAKQVDMFLKQVVPYRPCPYAFKYEYEMADGKRTGTCQDWETEATYFNWVKQYGVEKALAMMTTRWGEEMPAKGLLFAMGTHSLYPDTWLINGIIQMSDMGQLSLRL